ncbi:diacylglycerol/lipid kinase family protein [Sediminitomix flava]|uniref:Diacylglycerol kinase family enzyme n=1 Tax=Sediminitomix flava TaxID=379075 RepID=A0A315ZBA6_SEDFL|nr:diacylglycerol kinase family protein [Sediminitomix flava]PWJ42343.1 diacylglycerol kinase family enzyme [Sediminitomix flava]
MELLIILNPISGGYDKVEFQHTLHDILENEKISHQIYLTTGDKSDQSNLQSIILKELPKKLVAIGGDGTISFCIQIALKHQLPLGIIPFGSANGMAAELGLNTDPFLALYDIIKDNKRQSFDLLLFNGEYYGWHIADIGLNAQIVKDFHFDPNRGITAYIKQFFEKLTNAEVLSYQVEVDGKIHHLEGYMLAFANARKYGTGIHLNPLGNPSDGVFEICNVNTISFTSLAAAGISYLIPEIGLKYLDVISCKKAVIKTQKPTLLQIDGEVIGEFTTIEVEVIAQAIEVILPSTINVEQDSYKSIMSKNLFPFSNNIFASL